jgi:hypothetical protein
MGFSAIFIAQGSPESALADDEFASRWKAIAAGSGVMRVV